MSICDLSDKALTQYLQNQLNNYFPDFKKNKYLLHVVQKSLKKVKFNFSHIALSYYEKDGSPYFDYLNADHYTVFIYYCSNIAYEMNDLKLANKLFYLNKILHSFHCMYDAVLPEIFIVIHGIGSVLGKAKYSNFFIVTQGCTVGGNSKWEYPELDEYIIMYPNSSILGKSKISRKVVFANNSMVLNFNIKSNQTIIGQTPNVNTKKINTNIFKQFFKK
jgi:serine O-acetyltransferase